MVILTIVLSDPLAKIAPQALEGRILVRCARPVHPSARSPRGSSTSAGASRGESKRFTPRINDDRARAGASRAGPKGAKATPRRALESPRRHRARSLACLGSRGGSRVRTAEPALGRALLALAPLLFVALSASRVRILVYRRVAATRGSERRAGARRAGAPRFGSWRASIGKPWGGGKGRTDLVQELARARWATLRSRRAGAGRARERA